MSANLPKLLEDLQAKMKEVEESVKDDKTKTEELKVLNEAYREIGSWMDNELDTRLKNVRSKP